MAYANVTTPTADGMKDGRMSAWPMGASQTIYSGSAVNNDTSGNAVFFTARQAALFLGVAAETVTNGATAAANKVQVWHTGAHVFDCASADATWLGVEVYASTGTSGTSRAVINSADGLTGATKVGRVVEVISATKVRVRIDGYALKEVGA